MQDIDNKSDNDLVVLAQQDPNNFSYIIDRYRSKLTKYINRRTNLSNHDQEDILQDVFIKIYLNLNDYDKDLVFSSWVYRITHNYIIDWYRKNKKHIGISIDDEEGKLIHILQDENIFNQDDLHYQENIEIVKKEIKKLSQDYQDILILKFFEDKSYDEISDILKISTNSVGVKINRAKKILKQKIYE